VQLLYNDDKHWCSIRTPISSYLILPDDGPGRPKRVGKAICNNNNNNNNNNKYTG